MVETDHLIRQQRWGGYTRHIRIARDVMARIDGTVLWREHLLENHAIMMYSPLLPPSSECSDRADLHL